ncbi:MAG: restriction endonuclease subunit S [Anaerolineae bacterium]|jgi:type I restriction enzyme S subunit|nr:restriction endonuclease subunit S [Anaerolineae bacterium]
MKDTKTGAQIRAERLYRVEEGDFVYNRLFAWKGSFAVATAENAGCYVSNEFPCFHVELAKLDPKYLWFYFKRESAWNETLGLSYGATPTSRNRLKEANLLSMQIPLPPLAEQRRIVARIEALAARAEAARELREQVMAEVEALIHSALRASLKHIDGWDIKPISECSKMSTGKTPPSERDEYYGGQIQWYTPGDLGFHKKLGISPRTLSQLAIDEGKATIYEPGTILLVAIGASLGKVGLAQELCSSNQQITGIKFDPGIVPEYGFWWIRRLYDDLRAKASQATLPIINQRKIGTLEIVIPPLPEQHRIVAHLDALQAKITAVQQHQAATQVRLEALLPSILDRAFKGEL